MPNQKSKSRPITEDEEAKISAAKTAYEADQHKSIAAAAKAHGIEHLYFTLRQRIQGTARPRAEAHGPQQLLSRAEEETLVDWMKYLALTGHPLNAWTIRPKVQAILGSLLILTNIHDSKKTNAIPDFSSALVVRNVLLHRTRTRRPG